MKTPLQYLLLMIGLSSASLALAHDGTSRFMHYFDTNHDGVVTQTEFDSAMQARFKKMDADHNGVVSETEFQNYLKQRRLMHKRTFLEKMDNNHDGRVSESEYVSYMASRAKQQFKRMDKNHDGVLEASEFGSRYHHGHRFGRSLFHRLDTNGDGSISLAESKAAWQAWFKRLDRNGNKVITLDEVKAFHDHRAGRRAGQ